jgi:hypothetical protein
MIIKTSGLLSYVLVILTKEMEIFMIVNELIMVLKMFVNCKYIKMMLFLYIFFKIFNVNIILIFFK